MKKTKMLKKNYEFKEVLTKGKYYSGECIEAFIQPSKNKEKNYIGIAIGVKIAKAVKRNHLKRLIRESYKNCENYIKTGNRIVFLWKKKKEIKQATYKKINEDMKKIFEKSKIIEEEK